MTTQHDYKVTEHFLFSEITKSSTAARLGIDNSLPENLLDTAKKTLLRMEKVRVLIGHPIIIDSMYRCLPLNRVLKSADTSQHPKCEAIDFISPAAGTPTEICRFLLKNQDLIRWDQLILEHDWVHISWNSIPNGLQRGQVLSLLESGKYAAGLTDKKGNPL
jgi:hypothetical protein